MKVFNRPVQANFLRLRVYTEAERDALVNMEEGDVIYNSDDKSLNIYDGSSWEEISTE